MSADRGPGRRRYLVAGAIAVAIAIGLWLAYRPVPDQVQGMVDAREFRVASKVTGRLATVRVQEGERVAAGQLLATLDSPEVAAKAAQADAAVEAAQSQADKAEAGARPTDLDAAEAQWRRAQATADLAQVTYERVERLYGEGVVAGQKRDEARANARAAAEAARAARAQYEATRLGARTEDRRAARAQAAQARGAAAEVDAARSETRLVSPVAGEVGRRLAQPGEIVGAGFPVMLVTEVDAPWLALTLREDQLKGIRAGREFEGEVPALGGKTVRWRVYYVAPAGEFATWRATRQSSGFDVKSFEVRARPLAPPAALRPGMSVLVRWPQ